MSCSCNSIRCKHTPMVHLHLHTEYSALDGVAPSSEYVKLAKEFNHPAITILDHGNMSGTLTHFQQCKAANIKPIIGMEAYLNDDIKGRVNKEEETDSLKSSRTNSHQSIIVKDKIGFQNLNKLTYMSFTEGYYFKGRITTEWLFENKKGLIVTSSCAASKFSQLLQAGKEAEAEERIKLFLREFGDDFYAELQFNEFEDEGYSQKVYNRFILKMIKKYDIQPILTGDVHYADKDGAKLQDILIAIKAGKPVGDGPNCAWHLTTRQLYYSSVEDFHRLNKEMGFNYPESYVDMCLENTLKVAEKCTFEFETNVEKYPKYEATPDVVEYFKTNNTTEIISKLAHAKLKQKINLYRKNNIVKITPEVEQQYTDRLNYELKVIEDKKMLDYFMVVWELIRFCEKNEISIGPGRGCFIPGSRVKMSDGYYSPIETINAGDYVIDAFGKEQVVTNKLEYKIQEEIVELEFDNGKKITCTKDHEILTLNRGWIKAIELTEDDEISEIFDGLKSEKTTPSKS